MLKKLLTPALGFLAILYAGCNPKDLKNSNDRPLLSKNIEYDVCINNFKMASLNGLEGSSYLWYRNNLEGSVRTAFLEMLFTKILSGKLDLYDLNDHKIDTAALKKLNCLSTLSKLAVIYTNSFHFNVNGVINNLIAKLTYALCRLIFG